MARFHPLKVAALHRETPDCTVVTIEVPEDLRDEFAYQAGQHMNLKAQIDGQEVRRSYSLCSSPTEGVWRIAVKKLPGGVFSTWVNESLRPGDTLEAMKPAGRFVAMPDPTASRRSVAFAAGSGITPILSILKTRLALEPRGTFRLFDLNRSTRSILFREEIEALKNMHMGRFEVLHFLTRESRDIPLLNGRFDAEKIRALADRLFDPAATDECFICCPREMAHTIRDELVALGMPKEVIHIELFTAGAKTASDAARSTAAAAGTEVTVIDGGRSFHFTMGAETDNLLDAALAAGADLPFACKGGVCSTCRCRVVEGEVEMKVNYALEEADLAKRIVLSCQAVPVTPKLVVDFDV
jgi:ring-1,2-phenylacetyl-CoA epoxidase subunit PaaE